MFGSRYRLIIDLGVAELALILVLSVLTIWLYRETLPPTGRAKRTALILLRIAVFILMVFFLADPALVIKVNEERDPVIPLLIDISSSMGIVDDGGSRRMDSAIRDISRIKESLGKAKIDIIPFSTDIYGAVADIDSIPPAVMEGTDILYALGRVTDRYVSENLSAVIILSDGRSTRGVRSPSGRIPVKVYTVGYGDTIEGADAGIERIDIDRNLYIGTAVEAEVTVRVDGIRDKTLSIGLLAGDRTIDSVEINSPDRDGRFKTTLRFTPEREGEEELSVKIDQVEGEVITENNIETVRVTVFKDRIGILLIDQFPDWNMTFLKRLFDRSQRYSIDIVTASGGMEYRLLNSDEEWSLSQALEDPGKYEMIIVGDDRILFDSGPNTEILWKYVENGGAVLFTGSEDSPIAGKRGQKWLDELLPVIQREQVMIKFNDYYVTAAPLPHNLPIAISMATSGLAERLPPLLAAFSGFEAKAGAEVPLLLDDGSENIPMIAMHRFGDGVAAVILGFPIWRWKLSGEEGSRAYDSFFIGVTDYLVEGIDLPVISLDSERGVYLSGERVEMTVLARKGTLPEGIKGEIYNVDSERESMVRTFNFIQADRSEKIYRALLDPLSPGKYRIVASGQGQSGEKLSAAASIAVRQRSVEFLRRSGDYLFLSQIAAGSGGRSVDRGEIDQLGLLIDTKKEAVSRENTTSLRSLYHFFLIIVTLLAVEWSLRKFWGLV
ncbi:MAG: VWA domain-containing protein [Candidatus Krumholzibacteriota bacterium]|nr:VWA domain-containing protein [Candidatus Krumholzibacteriota bacterium]